MFACFPFLDGNIVFWYIFPHRWTRWKHLATIGNGQQPFFEIVIDLWNHVLFIVYQLSLSLYLSPSVFHSFVLFIYFDFVVFNSSAWLSNLRSNCVALEICLYLVGNDFQIDIENSCQLYFVFGSFLAKVQAFFVCCCCYCCSKSIGTQTGSTLDLIFRRKTWNLFHLVRKFLEKLSNCCCCCFLFVLRQQLRMIQRGRASFRSRRRIQACLSNSNELRKCAQFNSTR